MAELGALEAMAVQGAQEVMMELGALEAMADGLRGPWPRSPRPGPYSRNPFYPPKKNSLGKSGGIRSPPGLNRQDSTKRDRNALQGQTDRTGQPTGTGSSPGLARRMRLHLGMTRSQRPSQGPSATASTSTTRGQAARMASMATTRGAACPRRVSVDTTWQDLIKMFLWAQQNRHTALLAVTCGLSTGLGLAAASGHESAAIRRAWVSGDPAGLSRRAGGHWVSGDPVAWSPANGVPGVSGNPGTRQPAGGLGIVPAGGRYLPRSAGMRARGQRTRGDPAKLPRRPAVGYGGRTSGDFLAAGQTEEEQNKRLSKTENKTGWIGAAYGLVWSSVMVHTRGRNRNTQTRI